MADILDDETEQQEQQPATEAPALEAPAAVQPAQDTQPVKEEAQPAPVAEVQPAKEKPFDWSLLRGVPTGYVPIPTNVVGEATGSVWAANFKKNISIGAFINSPSSNFIDREAASKITTQEMINLIPRDLVLDYADRYIAKDPAHFKDITAQIRSELQDQQLLSQHPYQSFGVNAAEQFIDPINWLPMGAFYKNSKRASGLARAIIGSAATVAVGTSIQEAILQRNELTREAQESVFNIATAAVIGGALGAVGVGINARNRASKLDQIRARRSASKEVMDIFTDKDKELDTNGLLKDSDLANLPGFVRTAMKTSPMNRLVNSDSPTARFFSSAIYEHNYNLVKHLNESTDGASVETLTRLDTGKTKSMMIDYQAIFYDMLGIHEGPFKAIRAKFADASMNYDQFNEAVWQRLSNQVDHPSEHVNRAAKMLEDELFIPTRDKAVELGLLDEKQVPRNALGYITSVYNKNKIIEQGGKAARGAGSFPQFLHEKFTEIQEQIKQFKKSPIYKSTKNLLDKSKEQLKDEQARKRLIPKEDKAAHDAAKDTIKELKEKIKEHEETIRKAAPPKGLNSDGELFSVVNSKTLWAHVEQTIDHILGDSAGQMLNPILEKLKGGARPLKSRKMTIDQSDMMEWHITDIPKIVEMYSRAMHPTIRLTEFAQKLGAKDIPEMREKLSEMIMKEYEQGTQGKTGKDATKLRQQRDADIADMKVSLELIQGVYGDGPNVLNNSARTFYQNLMKWNYIRLLGYMTVSSLADAGLQVFVHGPYRFIHEGLVQSFSGVRQIAKQDLRAIGYAIETELGTRLKSYAEHQGLSTNPGPFTKGLDALTKAFGNLSLMNQWNEWQQAMAGHIGINRTLQTIHKFMRGEKVSKIEMERVMRNGLDKEHWKTIYEFTKDNNSDGTLFADWTNWDIKTKEQANALTQFQASVAKEIENIVIVPGLGDKLKLGIIDTHTPVGKLLFQFKSFLMASTNRVTISGIQRRNDINTYLGVVSMLGMGAMSYVVASLLKGKEPDLSFGNLSREAVDKSGVLGIWGELGTIGQKALGFNTTSRYASRDLMGTFMGPSYGAASEVINILNKITASLHPDGESLTTKDAQKLMRLAPYQNLFYLEQMNKKLTRGLALSLGAKDNE